MGNGSDRTGEGGVIREKLEELAREWGRAWGGRVTPTGRARSPYEQGFADALDRCEQELRAALSALPEETDGERVIRHEDGSPHESHRWERSTEVGIAPPVGHRLWTCVGCGVDIEDDEALVACRARLRSPAPQDVVDDSEYPPRIWVEFDPWDDEAESRAWTVYTEPAKDGSNVGHIYIREDVAARLLLSDCALSPAPDGEQTRSAFEAGWDARGRACYPDPMDHEFELAFSQWQETQTPKEV